MLGGLNAGQSLKASAPQGVAGLDFSLNQGNGTSGILRKLRDMIIPPAGATTAIPGYEQEVDPSNPEQVKAAQRAMGMKGKQVDGLAGDKTMERLRPHNEEIIARRKPAPPPQMSERERKEFDREDRSLKNEELKKIDYAAGAGPYIDKLKGVMPKEWAEVAGSATDWVGKYGPALGGYIIGHGMRHGGGAMLNKAAKTQNEQIMAIGNKSTNAGSSVKSNSDLAARAGNYDAARDIVGKSGSSSPGFMSESAGSTFAKQHGPDAVILGSLGGAALYSKGQVAELEKQHAAAAEAFKADPSPINRKKMLGIEADLNTQQTLLKGETTAALGSLTGKYAGRYTGRAGNPPTTGGFLGFGAKPDPAFGPALSNLHADNRAVEMSKFNKAPVGGAPAPQGPGWWARTFGGSGMPYYGKGAGPAGGGPAGGGPAGGGSNQAPYPGPGPERDAARQEFINMRKAGPVTSADAEANQVLGQYRGVGKLAEKTSNAAGRRIASGKSEPDTLQKLENMIGKKKGYLGLGGLTAGGIITQRELDEIERASGHQQRLY
jgi:hypothetical protein